MALYNESILKNAVARIMAVLGSAISATTAAFSGAVTMATTLAVTGATTLTGGIVASTLARISTIPIGPVAYGSLGTSAVHVAGTLYYTEIWIPANKTITGISVLNGATAGTDNLIVALYSNAGVLLASSALAGTLSAGANAFQDIAFTAPYAAIGPGRYWVVVQCNGTTATTRRIAASTYLNRAGSAVGVFGTLAAITPPTTFTADVGPIAAVY
jgi:hypothetical protein